MRQLQEKILLLIMLWMLLIQTSSQIMNFSTLFRTKENLNLDKSTLTILRYIAIFGQFLAINIVYFYMGLPFPIELSIIIIFIGLTTNLYLQFGIKINQLKDFYSLIFLIYDLIQLSILLYLTGGIFNPFSFLLIRILQFVWFLTQSECS